MASKYIIMTLNPEKIINKATYELKGNDHYECEFHLDFTEGSFEESSALISAEKSRENALFTQIILAMKENSRRLSISEDLLKYQLFYLDFSKLFLRNSLHEPFDAAEFENRVDSMTKEEVQRLNLHQYLFFLFRNGFYIRFDDEERHYVSFDSSASMTRSSRISFINEKLKSQIDERLLLGMDLTNEEYGIKVAPNKYFAYRGLYMTDALRVETNENFILNEETVIVLPDAMYTTEKIDTISAIETENGYWKIGSKEDEININPFDGEGLIHPDFADEINCQLFQNKAKATSFQIRMPFTKGMLHRVDYISFIDQECHANPSKEYWVMDYFGFKRDLRKAKIILTKSMQKNADWLKAYVQTAIGESEDPMRFLFERMQYYKHSLYIARTDLNLHNESKRVKLNYQSLKTLCMTQGEFRKKIQVYIDEIKEIETDPIKLREFVLGETENSYSTWKYALSRNLSVLTDDYIKEQVKNVIDSAIRGIYRGNIIVSGENRFLSCDLLAFMGHILKCAEDPDENCIEELRGYYIKRDSFKAPTPLVTLKNGEKYGFLRNPHMSGNEDCVLTLQKRNKYDKYFDHLSGIIMNSYDSLAPMTLGGADFDGDMVKMITDEDIILAMEKSKNNHKELIVIPSAKEEPVKFPEKTEYVHVKDTYGNQIGTVCNCAMKLQDGKPKALDEEGKNHIYIPSDCTILAGLEIDSAKNGKHPRENIDQLKEKFKGSTKLDYIRMLNMLDDVKWNEVKINSTKKTLKKPKVVKISAKNRKILKALNVPESELQDKYLYQIVVEDSSKNVSIDKRFEKEYEGYSNLEMLMPMFFTTMYSQRGNMKDAKKLKAIYASALFCENEEDMNRNDEVSSKKLQDCYAYAEVIMKVYKIYSKRFRAILNEDKKISKQEWFAKAYTIAKQQYFGQEDFESNLSSLKGLYAMLEYVIVETPAGFAKTDSIQWKCKNIADRIKDTKWIYQPEEKRVDTLKKILPEEDFDLLYEKTVWIDLLTNFSKSGYMILYYLIKEIEKTNVNIKDRAEENLIQAGLSNRFDITRDYWEVIYAQVFNEFGAAFKKAIKYKYTFSAFENLLMDTLRERLMENEILNEECLAMNLYVQKPDFFWKLYDGKKGLESFSKGHFIQDYLPYSEMPNYSEFEEYQRIEESLDGEED